MRKFEMSQGLLQLDLGEGCRNSANHAPATKDKKKGQTPWGLTLFLSLPLAQCVGIQKEQAHPSRPGAGAPVNRRRDNA